MSEGRRPDIQSFVDVWQMESYSLEPSIPFCFWDALYLASVGVGVFLDLNCQELGQIDQEPVAFQLDKARLPVRTELCVGQQHQFVRLLVLEHRVLGHLPSIESLPVFQLGYYKQEFFPAVPVESRGELALTTRTMSRAA